MKENAGKREKKGGKWRWGIYSAFSPSSVLYVSLPLLHSYGPPFFSHLDIFFLFFTFTFDQYPHYLHCYSFFYCDSFFSYFIATPWFLRHTSKYSSSSFLLFPLLCPFSSRLHASPPPHLHPASHLPPLPSSLYSFLPISAILFFFSLSLTLSSPALFQLHIFSWLVLLLTCIFFSFLAFNLFRWWNNSSSWYLSFLLVIPPWLMPCVYYPFVLIIAFN